MMLTPLHFIYLAVIIVVIVLMIMKHDVVAPCILGIFILGTAFSGGVIGGAQAVFNSMLYAMGDLGDIMLVIALMVAMLKSLEHMGADQMMIAPAAKLLKTPRVAFWVIAIIMYVCASFFWPTPATALVGTILIPVALKAGLAPMMACIAMNLAGHGMALSGDLVLQGAPKLSATAANVDITEVLKWGGILATIAGVIALVLAFIKYQKEIVSGVQLDADHAVAKAAAAMDQKVERPGYAKFFAILVPVVYIAILIRILAGAFSESVPAIFGGDATALLGGSAAIILLLACAVHHKQSALEELAGCIRAGFLFSIKIFAVVIPIAAFFFLGNPEAAPAILGEGAPGFLFELGQALGDVLPMNRVVLAIGIVLIGGITGLDGSGFSGVPLVAALAAALGGPAGYNVALLAALGQVAAIWVGGGTLSAWAFGAVASAGVAGVEPADLVRKNFVPVMTALGVITLITVVLM